jgi:hypothetical protein
VTSSKTAELRAYDAIPDASGVLNVDFASPAILVTKSQKRWLRTA